MLRIDRHKIYESHGYTFINFVCLTDEEKQMVLDWRNHEKVRCMMLNKDVISLENHLAFIENLNTRDDCYYWLVKDPTGCNVGVLDVIHVDYEEDQGEIGFYIDPDQSGKGFMFMIECLFFVYKQIQLGNNIVTVNINNREILLFNKYLGTSFDTIEKIDDDYFCISRRSNGKFIVDHYDEFNLMDYARFIKKHRREKLLS